MDEIKVFCSHTEMRDPVSLVEHPRNYNTHPAEQIRLLAKIIKHQGWRNPITVSKRSGYVVKGHGRLAAAMLLKCEEVPIDLQDYKDEASELADMIADNRIAELAEADQDALKSLLLDETFNDFDIELTGFENVDFLNNETSETKEDKPMVEFSEELDESHNYVVLYFDNDMDWLSAQSHFDIKNVGTPYSKRANGKPWSIGVGRVINGSSYLASIS
jgi:hypothetical protein